MDGSKHGPILVPVSLGVAPYDVTLALVAQLVETLGAAVIDMDVMATDRATFTLRIPCGQSTATEQE